MSTVPEYFASRVFDDKVMRARLPEKVYKSLRQTIDQGKPTPWRPPCAPGPLKTARRTSPTGSSR